MQILSKNIRNGYLADEFGHLGTQFIKSKPSRSFHIAWEKIPQNTQSIAIIFIDHDAIPVCGFSWIHWTIANIDPSLGELPENASLDMDLLEGVTSWNSPLLPLERRLSVEEATGFGGSAPPDKTHQYTVQAYALDCLLTLKRGFYLNDLLKSMAPHIIDQAELHFLYKNKRLDG